MRNKNRLSLILVFLLIVFLSIPSLCSADNTAANKITDLSDRKYEQALIELLDNAKESIVVSMYGISPGTGEKNPVRLLLNDLLEARKRGVSVTMYLNTRFRDTAKAEGPFIGSPIFKELLINKKYFARMVTKQDNRVFDLYLLLLAHSQLMGEDEFFINLEDMALSLGLPDTMDYTSLRRQVIRSLKRLQNRYNLVTVKFLHGKDAYIIIANTMTHDSVIASPPRRTKQSHSTITTDTIIKPRNPKPTLRLKCLLLIKALLKNEGKDLHSITKSDLAKRFNINKTTVQEAFKDLREYTD